MTKTALITGVSGQDGAYLARLLLAKGYRVIGTTRRKAPPGPTRLDKLGIARDVELIELDLGEYATLVAALETAKPDEVYNLAAESRVVDSLVRPLNVIDANGCGVARLLEAIRIVGPNIRLYQASSSEMFGTGNQELQNENTAFRPQSPYACAKLFAHWLTVSYRENFGLFAAAGIKFNHESPLRDRAYVVRKITLGLAEIKHRQRDCLWLGNIDVRRDWGFAGDYVEGMWRMLQNDVASDYVLATGVATDIRRIVELAADSLGLRIEWIGKAMKEIGVEAKSGRTLVQIDPGFYRPVDVTYSVGSSLKAEAELGWRPRMSINELIGMMADADDRCVRDGLAPW
jgi:GDPmannose 4,6-dehydratase